MRASRRVIKFFFCGAEILSPNRVAARCVVEIRANEQRLLRSERIVENQQLFTIRGALKMARRLTILTKQQKATGEKTFF